MAGLFDDDTTTTTVKKQPTSWDNFVSGNQGGMMKIPGTYGDPTLSPSAKRMMMLGQVASVAPHLSDAISKMNVGVNIYQGVAKTLDGWLTEDKGKKKEQSTLSDQAAQTGYNKSVGKGAPPLVGFLTNIIQGLGSMLAGGAMKAGAGALATGAATTSSGAGAGAASAPPSAPPVEVLDV